MCVGGEGRENNTKQQQTMVIVYEMNSRLNMQPLIRQ